MKKKLCSIVLFWLLIAVSSAVWANPPCPRRADSLEAFAQCTSPIVGANGRVLGRVANAAQMDPHAARVMNVMRNAVVTAPQVHPSVPATTLASNLAVAYSIYHRNGYFFYPYSPYMPYVPYGFWLTVTP